MKVNYNCKDNDVELQFHYDEEGIDEVWVRVIGETGWTVIGFNDLLSAITSVQSKINSITIKKFAMFLRKLKNNNDKDISSKKV
jgi:hypothetical protein